MKFNDMRVATKLWATILGLLLAMLLVTVWVQARSRQVTQATDNLVAQFENSITTAVTWRGMANMAINMNMSSLVTTDEALSKDFDTKVAALTASITPIQEQINKTIATPADKAALESVAAARADIRGQGDKVKELKAARDAAASQAYLEKDYRPRAQAYLDAIDKYVAVQIKQRDEAKQAAAAASDNVALVAVASMLLVFALGVVLASALVRSILRPLQRAVAATDAIAAGDLTQDIQDLRKDEFGDLLRSLSTMVGKLRGVVSEVRTGVDSVSHASHEIATGNQDLSARTEQTAANLQQTASSMEELTSTVTQSTDTARQANQLAATAAEAATRGGEVVAQVVSTMQNISAASHKISDIIGTIDGIAFQTNILALNAAVEAARAGEQGRGFAVVASEVRSLAQRSAQAAKEIKTLISASVETVQSGTQQVAQAGEAMGEIVSSVRRVSDLIGEISASSSEQRDGINQVNQAVSNLDQMTQQNAALVEQSAAAASGLRDQSQRLSEVVSVFNVGASATQAVAVRMAPRAAPVRAAPAAKLPAPKATKILGKVPVRLGTTPVSAPAKARTLQTPVPTKSFAGGTAGRKAIAHTPNASSKAASNGSEGEWESF